MEAPPGTRKQADGRLATSRLDQIGDLQAQPGSRPWALAVRAELQSYVHNTEWDVDLAPVRRW